MPVSEFSDRVRSLAAAAAGEAVEIRYILFDGVRGICAELGVEEGDVVHCRAGTPSHLLLETPGGRTVAVDRSWAQFIHVSGPLNVGLEEHGLLSRAAG